MGKILIRQLRRTVGLVWVALLLSLLGLVGINMLGPKLGFEIFIIRGSSMAPAIPLGSLIAAQPVDPSSLSVGEIVSVGAPNGAVSTHRIVGIDTSHAELRFELRGDRNQTADGALVTASAVIGRVTSYAPWLGYLLALLSMPSGVVSVMSSLAALLLSYWLLEDLEAEGAAATSPAKMPGTVPEPAPEPKPVAPTPGSLPA